MDNKTDFFNFMTAIVKVYMMTFFLRMILGLIDSDTAFLKLLDDDVDKTEPSKEMDCSKCFCILQNKNVSSKMKTAKE